jgi:hypothetical protein
MTTNTEKIIKILDPQAGTLQETVIDSNPVSTVDAKQLFEGIRRNGKRITLEEASTTGEFPVILRDGIRSIVFDSYAGQPTTWQEWAMQMPSDKPAEDWVEESQIGELPVVSENTPYTEFKQDLDRTLQIKNYKRGGIISVTEEMIRFNRLNILKRQAEKLGRAAANTRDQACYSVAFATGNYTRTTAAGDNDIGNNTAAAIFGPSTLATAFATIRTMKDRKSGVYLGIEPDTLIVHSNLEFFAKQLLLSPSLQAFVQKPVVDAPYGQGTANPFKGLIKQIIVSPRVATAWGWCLMQARQAVVLQEVEGLQILQESVGQVQQEGYFRYDNIRYRVRDWYGVGMLNDRYAYLSSSATAPTVA